MIHDLTYVKIRYHNTRLIENTWTHPGHIWIALEAYYTSWKHLDAHEAHTVSKHCARGAFSLRLRCVTSLENNLMRPWCTWIAPEAHYISPLPLPPHPRHQFTTTTTSPLLRPHLHPYHNHFTTTTATMPPPLPPPPHPIKLYFGLKITTFSSSCMVWLNTLFLVWKCQSIARWEPKDV